MAKKAKFFVCSDGDSPECIKFTLEDAKAVCSRFIDAFDEEGELVETLEIGADFGSREHGKK